ncbi:MAG: hypothetical protein RR145_01255 [Oscillospiraceae bacterium]
MNLYNKFMPSDSAMRPVYGTIQSGGVVIEKGIDNTLVKVNLKGDFETMVCLIKYKGDTLLDAKTDTKVLTSETTEFRLTIPNKKVDETIKLFIWNAKNLTPISVPQVIE